jgi:hypothetical protein
VGVLTVYSEHAAAYSDQHIKLMGVLGPRLANAVSKSRQFDQENERPPLDEEPDSQMVATYRSTCRSRQFVKQLAAVPFFSWNRLFLLRHSMGKMNRDFARCGDGALLAPSR